MIETATNSNNINSQQQLNSREDQPVLRMKKHSRMAGSVPVWEKQQTAKDNIQSELANATQDANSFDSALAYAGNSYEGSDGIEPFGFGDLFDMVNPLQHIPLVNRVYRDATGDDIKPISRIIGGSIYGGPAGGAIGIADTISEYETGRDMAGNAFHVARGGSVELKSTADHPEKNLNVAAMQDQSEPTSEIPGSALSFVDLGYGKREVIEYVPIADGRTAGSMMKKSTEVHVPELEYQQPIEQININPMPPRYNFNLNS